MIIQDKIFLLLIPLAILIIYVGNRFFYNGSIRFSSLKIFKPLKATPKIIFLRFLWVFRLVSLILLALALCRFRLPIQHSRIESEGVDIILAIDVSGSMLAEDFTLNGKRANRLEVVKNVVEEFILGRRYDRMGIVAFAGRAYTVSPLTLDHAWLLENLKRLSIGMIEDGTAIGSGIMVSLKRLENSQAKSKVVILLTDGMNNAGNISPRLAAEAAKALKVKVYTIGAGTKGLAPYPVKDFFGNTIYQPMKIDVDEDTLKEIASKTGGLYFRATDTHSLKEIYSAIDRMEKSRFEERGFVDYEEKFSGFVLVSMVFLLSEIGLANTFLRRLP